MNYKFALLIIFLFLISCEKKYTEIEFNKNFEHYSNKVLLERLSAHFYLIYPAQYLSELTNHPKRTYKKKRIVLTVLSTSSDFLSIPAAVLGLNDKISFSKLLCPRSCIASKINLQVSPM